MGGQGGVPAFNRIERAKLISYAAIVPFAVFRIGGPAWPGHTGQVSAAGSRACNRTPTVPRDLIIRRIASLRPDGVLRPLTLRDRSGLTPFELWREEPMRTIETQLACRHGRGCGRHVLCRGGSPGVGTTAAR